MIQTSGKCIVFLLVVWFLLNLATSTVHASTANKTHTGVLMSKRKDTFRCFVCFWSMNDEPCGDLNFDVDTSTPGKFMFNCQACYKTAFHSANGEKVKVLRGCAQELPYYALTCQQIFNQDGSFMETCACASAYCNKAPTGTRLSHLLALSSILLITLL